MKNLLAALGAVRAELGHTIHADAEGKYGHYVPLEKVLAVIEPAATKHGLLNLQAVQLRDGAPYLETIVYHLESGESLIGQYLLVTDKPGPQGLGASETYARRRSLMTIYGIASSEGDPDAHQNAPAMRQAAPQRAAVPAQAQRHQPTQSNYSVAAKHISFGKFKGMPYGGLPLADLLNYGDWLKRKAQEDGKPLSKNAEEFLSDVQLLQMEHETGFAEDSNVPF